MNYLTLFLPLTLLVIDSPVHAADDGVLSINGCRIEADSQCPNADLRGADLSHRDMRRMNLVGADLSAPTCVTPASTWPIWNRPGCVAPT